MTIANMVFSPTGGLNDATYSPTNPVNEAAIRSQIQGVSDQLRDYINNILNPYNANTYETITDLTTNRKLSATGDFTGTLNGLPITATDPALSSTVNAILAETITVNVKHYGAVGDGVHDDTTAFQTALNIARLGNASLILNVPDGTYKLTATLVIYKNTTINATSKATMLRAGTGYASMLANGVFGDLTATGYTGNGNIKLIGGIYDINANNSLVNMPFFPIAHAKNILLKDIIVRNGTGHAHEFAACDGVVIDGCRYEGFFPNLDYNPAYLECIQLDTMQESSFPYFGSYDLTVTKNVTIKNCYFGVGDAAAGAVPWRTAIGNHGAYNGQTIGNVLIENCIFDSMSYAGVRPCKWGDVTIRNNKFYNCARGVHHFVPSGSTDDCTGVTIEDNTFTGCNVGAAIRVEGLYNTTYDNSYTIKGVRIYENRIEAIDPSITAIELLYCDSAIVNGNVCKTASRFIVIQRCRSIQMINNQTDTLTIGFTLIYDLSENVIIANNYSRNSGETQININPCTNFVISNNIFRNNCTTVNNSKVIINIQGTSSVGTIANNIMGSDAGITNLPSMGISVASTASGVGIFNNIVTEVVGKKVSNSQTAKYDFLMYDSNGDRYNTSVSTAGALVLTKV